MGAWTRRQGKARWGEKTPQHTLCWRTILEGFPDVQVIHLIRDGRDVALSYRAAHFGPKHVYHLAPRWMQYLSAAEEAQAALGEARVPAGALRGSAGAAGGGAAAGVRVSGGAFDPDMLAFHRTAAAYPTDQRNEANLRKPILAGNVQKWRTEMTAREVRLFEAIAGPQLERYGYERARRDARISTWEALSCRYIEHPPRRAIAILNNHQGHRLALQDLRFRLRVRFGL